MIPSLKIRGSFELPPLVRNDMKPPYLQIFSNGSAANSQVEGADSLGALAYSLEIASVLQIGSCRHACVGWIPGNCAR